MTKLFKIFKRTKFVFCTYKTMDINQQLIELLLSPENLRYTFEDNADSLTSPMINITLPTRIIYQHSNIFRQIIDDYPQYNLCCFLEQSRTPNHSMVVLIQEESVYGNFTGLNFWEEIATEPDEENPNQ